MDSPVEEIRKRIDIVEFIGQFLDLKKSGRNYKANCPFHQEKTPSFVISPDRQIWHCFGSCADGGDVIKFVMKWENITFFEAIRELAEKTGVKLATVDFDDPSWKGREKIFSINSIASDFYHYILTTHPIGEKCLDYVKSRGLGDKLIKTFQLGYSPSSWDSLLKYLKKKGFSYEDAHESGLAIKSERGSFYDRFRSRLMFPLKDHRGNILGFSGRSLTGEGDAKYVNTPETSVYHKRETLFGIDAAIESIKKADRAILVEGEFDAISSFKEGLTNTVAIKGSAVTRDQLMLIKRFTKKLTLALDMDSSGNETTKKAIWECEYLDMEVSIAQFKYGKDPDEAIQKDVSAFKESVRNPLPIYDFIISSACEKYPTNDAMAKKNIGAEVIPYLARIQNPIVKSHYIKKIADILEVSTNLVDNLIFKELKRAKLKKSSTITFKTTSFKNRFELLQKYILSLVFQNIENSALIDKIFQIVETDDFTIPSYKKLLDHYILYQDQAKKDLFTASLPPELIATYDEAIIFDIEIFDAAIVDADVEKTCYELKRFSIKDKIKNMVQNDENKKTDEKINNLLHALSDVEKAMAIL